MGFTPKRSAHALPANIEATLLYQKANPASINTDAMVNLFDALQQPLGPVLPQKPLKPATNPEQSAIQKLALHLQQQQQLGVDLHQNTQQVFKQLLKTIPQCINQLKLILPKQASDQVHYWIDPDESMARVQILWHRICFMQRGNISPMALPVQQATYSTEPAAPTPVGRIIALFDDDPQMMSHFLSQEMDAQAWLGYEVASLYVPAELHQTWFYLAAGEPASQANRVAPETGCTFFIEQVLNAVCYGGKLHEQLF